VFFPVGALVRSALTVACGVPTVAVAEAAAEYVAGHIRARLHTPPEPPLRQSDCL
jgi:hypothetical protein